jgi:hypothetical protein
MKNILMTIGISIAFLFGIVIMTVGLNFFMAVFGLWFVIPLLLVAIAGMVYHIHMFVTGKQ